MARASRVFGGFDALRFAFGAHFVALSVPDSSYSHLSKLRHGFIEISPYVRTQSGGPAVISEISAKRRQKSKIRIENRLWFEPRAFSVVSIRCGSHLAHILWPQVSQTRVSATLKPTSTRFHRDFAYFLHSQRGPTVIIGIGAKWAQLLGAENPTCVSYSFELSMPEISFTAFPGLARRCSELNQ